MHCHHSNFTVNRNRAGAGGNLKKCIQNIYTGAGHNLKVGGYML